MDVIDTIDSTSLEEVSSGEVGQEVQVSGPETVATDETGAAKEPGADASETDTGTDTGYAQIEGTLIYAESGTAGTDISAALSGWSLIPEGVRGKLTEYGMKVYLSETACANIGLTYGGYAYGVQYEANAADLKITSITQNAYCIIGTGGDIEGTVLHEVAHLLDFGIAVLEEGVYSTNNCRISGSEEWQKICEKDGARIAAIDSQTAANSYSEKELFAEAFRVAYQDPEELIAASRDAYDFVMTMVEKYTSAAG